MRSTILLLRRNAPLLWKRSENACSAHCESILITRGLHEEYDQRGSRERSTKVPFARIAALTAVTCGAIYEYKAKRSTLTTLYAAEGDKKQGVAGGASRRNAYNFLADVVEMSGPAVVYIECMDINRFTNQQVPVSHGSGFTVESSGWIITNAHVVGNKSRVKVRLQDGRELEGRVIGVDEGTDLAAIEIKAKSLPYLPLGCSNDIRPGEWVVAMGSPLNFKNTGTAGIVSNIQRAGKELGLMDEDKKDMAYIQTDAMIDVGNSGGPLINLDGEVIGVNSMMASAGIAFAIPVDYVKDFIFRLKRALGQRRNSAEQVSPLPGRRYIGVTMLTVTQDIADQLQQRRPDFPNVVGVLVHEVKPNSPADRAGMQSGDVIIKIDEKEVRLSQDVFTAMAGSSCIQVTIRRGNKTLELRVEPEDVK